MTAQPDHPEERARARRYLAILRMVAVVALCLVPAVIADPALPPLFTALALAAAAYAVIGWSVAHGHLMPSPPVAVCGSLDVAFITALTYASGGAGSDLRSGCLLVPLGAALLLRPRWVAGWTLVAAGGYLVAAIPPQVNAVENEGGHFDVLVALGLIGIAGIMISTLSLRREERIVVLDGELRATMESRAHLVAGALDTEKRERRRFSEGLHDTVLPALRTAQQDLVEAEEGVPGRLGRARTALDDVTHKLREQIFDLYPPILEQVGLAGALPVLAEHQGERGGFQASVSVDPAACGVDDHFIYRVIHELLTNAADHARASSVRVDLASRDGTLALKVADDGVGCTADRQAAALEESHIGLLSIAEQVNALGGAFTVDGTSGAGTVVTARVPIDRERRRVPRPTSSPREDAGG